MNIAQDRFEGNLDAIRVISSSMPVADDHRWPPSCKMPSCKWPEERGSRFPLVFSGGPASRPVRHLA
jgi:hypothetical protein